MKTSSAKAKGRRLAAAVKEALHRWAPDLKPEDINVTPSGVCGEDIYLSPAAREVYGLCFECKNQEALNIWAALDQAKTHAKGREHLIPIVAFKRNKSDIYVSLLLEDFLKLIR